MSPAKPKPKISDERRTVEEARRAFADSTAAITAGYVFRLRHAWEAVAINLPAIEALRLAEKSWDEIGEQLAAACGLPTIAGQSVRVFRSRLKNGYYDAQLGQLGLRREGKILLPLAVEDGKGGGDDARDDVPAPSGAAQREPATETRHDAAPGDAGSQIGAGSTQPLPEAPASNDAIAQNAAAAVPAPPRVVTAPLKPPVPDGQALIRFKQDPE